MPTKIDWELRAKAQMVKKALNKQNAIINAFREGNVTKAEILSGTELLPRDPVQQALFNEQAKQTVKDRESRDMANEQIINRLEAIG